jgi:ribosomal protein L7/L12
MKTCPQCSSENPDSARFCAGCGGSVQSALEVFLQQHDLMKLLKPIQDNDFTTAEELLTLSDSDLGELGLSLGDKIRLKKALDTLSSEEDDGEEMEDAEEDEEESLEEECVSEAEDAVLECTGFTLTTETDITLFDPSAEDIKRLVWDDDERGAFLILEHADDGRFMQALLIHQEDEGGFELEFNDAVGEDHFATTELVSRHELLDALVKYGTGDNSWRKSHAWKKKTHKKPVQEIQVEFEKTGGISPDEQFHEILQALPPNDRVYVAPNIPTDKFNAAYNSYVKKQGVEAYLMYDVTLFRGAKDGFILAKDGLYIKDMGDKPFFYPYSDISKIERLKLKIFINGEKKMLCISISEGYLDDIIKMIKIKSGLDSDEDSKNGNNFINRTVNLVLIYCGSNKIKLIEEMRKIRPALGLAEAKALVENLPQVISQGISREEAHRLQKMIEATGSKVEIQ